MGGGKTSGAHRESQDQNQDIDSCNYRDVQGSGSLPSPGSAELVTVPLVTSSLPDF